MSFRNLVEYLDEYTMHRMFPSAGVPIHSLLLLALDYTMQVE